jgi:prolyl-tRNA editing enzyme YbaK/EbsC (Cys-tRNA(Pro) deacylase)
MSAPRADGSLPWRPVDESPELIAHAVGVGLSGWAAADRVRVAPIDPDLADTAEFCAAYQVPLTASANCVIVSGKRDGLIRYAACLVLATMRADVNGVVRRRLDVRKASFAAMDDAVALSGMEYGGITPIGLPVDWPVYVSAEVVGAGQVVIGSGIRGSKLSVPGSALLSLPTAVEVADLARLVSD